MDSDQIIPPTDNIELKKDTSKTKKALIIIILILVLSGIASFSYFLGTKSQNSQEVSSTPTPSEEPVVSETPTPTPSPIVSGNPTATKKPTPTAKPSLTTTPSVKTKILPSTASLDGFRSSNGGGNAALEIRAGRNANLVTRGFVSFDISDIPEGVTIQEVTLRLYQADIKGNPYGVGGSLKIDHLTYGDSLDNADYGAAAISSSFTTLSGNAVKEWKDAIVTDAVKNDISNARSRSDFRIHFQIENTGGNSEGDFAYFEASENNMATGNTPQLVVKYY